MERKRSDAITPVNCGPSSREERSNFQGEERDQEKWQKGTADRKQNQGFETAQMRPFYVRCDEKEGRGDEEN